MTGSKGSGTRHGRSVLSTLLCSIAAISLVAKPTPAQRQSGKVDNELLAQYEQGPHVGTVQDAVVMVEVTTRSSDGAASQTRRAPGVVLRCDGFVLAPVSVFNASISVAGQAETGKQAVTVILNPGTAQEKRVPARRPRYNPPSTGYAVCKMEAVHALALPTLLPDTLKPGDAVQIAWAGFDNGANRYTPLVLQSATLGTPPAPAEAKLTTNGEATSEAGEVFLREPSNGTPRGAVVISQGRAVGMVTSFNTATPPVCDHFLSFSVLDEVTNCVTPLPTPAETGGEGMVEVAGGPVPLSAALQREQPDMEGAGTACVAPFKIDKLEVTNRQYLAFWLTLPEASRKRLDVQSRYYPTAWSKAGTPFPASLAEMPVLGVPLPGAEAYAKAQGKRLPTPYEWCAAAFGPQGEQGVDWARRYVADRLEVWSRARLMHIEYLRTHPEIQQEEYFTPTPFTMPWLNASPATQTAARWSKQTVESLTEPLWTAWHDPLYILQTGTRDYDVSPCGARDMFLNASEMVAPYPGQPAKGNARYMEMVWLPRELPKDDPWRPRTITVLADIGILPPMSRLYRRSYLSPPNDELLSMQNMSEDIGMLAPLGGWTLRISSDIGATISGLLPKRAPGGPIVIKMPGADLYEGMPRHLRVEMGLPVPVDTVEPRVSNGPQLFYIKPAGFRCAR